MANNQTIFQKLSNAFKGSVNTSVSNDVISSTYGDMNPNRILYTTNDKNDYERKLKTLQQQKYLAYQWKKAGADNAMASLAGYTAVKLMYRDADLMDGTCEIGSALDIISEETCPIVSNGKMLNIKSRSPRTKAILEDLFVNRLHIYTELPMISRHLCKYGNTFELLNIDKDNGIMGWMMIPVYEIDRIENGYSASYTSSMISNTTDITPDEVKFIWRGHNGDNPYFNWQIAHFRLLNDSFFLPYGVSMLHKARRHWRMWSMMEDAMLLWALDKAVERRVFKVYVGGIDDADVEAYVQTIANNFKRTSIVDPETGQLDVRKNFIDISGDYFIPVRREDAPNPIETLQSSNNQFQMDMLSYMQNKIFAVMRTPKSFLNFQDSQGKNQNLSFVDVRFARMVNRIQQYLLMELNKIAMIHLFILGLNDEINNFTITLNNPSSQIETQELDDLNKRLSAMQTALADPGTGIPMMSMHKALKEIMKMSDSEIKDMLGEIRLEKAMAAELAATANIIKKTGMFDNIDRIYGDYDAMNNGGYEKTQQGQDDEMGGGFGGGGGAIVPDMGDGMNMDMGEPGGEIGSDLGGDMGETDMADAPAADEGTPIMENKKTIKSFTQQYFDMLSKSQKESGEVIDEAFDFETKNTTLNNQVKKIFNKIDYITENIEKSEDIIVDCGISGNTEILSKENE